MPSAPETADLKRRACARIDELAPVLIETARQIYDNPEVAFEERQAASWLADLLARHGFAVERGVGTLPTAFTARLAGRGNGPSIGLFSEYDALPDLGHGCGHHLLAISGVGAGLGLTAVMPDLAGTIRVQGTPAEEGPSGKTILLRNGAFDGLDAALIFHPSDHANILEKMRTGQGIRFTFTGKYAHAAAHPEQAIDALTGVLAMFNNVNLLRQHFRPDVSVTGHIPDGGQHAFPVTATAHFGVRVFEGETDFVELRQRIVDCARTAALATRTGLSISYGVLERGMKLNESLTRSVVDNAATSLDVDLSTRVTMGGMSDFGNVSHKMPATHFSTATWPPGVKAHTPEAVAAGGAPAAFAAALDAAKIEAMTAIDLLVDPALMDAVRAEFAANATGEIPEVPAEA
jgi:amidohydrolase